MKHLVFALALVGALVPSPGRAQVKLDMTKITCGDVLAMSPEDQSDIAAFMSGWFSQKSGRTYIDAALFQKNVASVMAWCGSNKSESVMAGLQRAYEKK